MKTQSTRILAVVLSTALASTSAITPVWAQNASSGIEEVLVTARRVTENIQKVPISITAISSDQLSKRSIFNDTDLQSAVPGLVIHQSGSANQFNYSIRGQSVDTYTNSPPAVVVYTNEVPIKTNGASSLYDLENIQVLKGPQGTLFGRNTTGGAILYKTAQPGETIEGYIKGRYGNHESKYLEGAISFPITDKLGIRIAGAYTGGGAFQYDRLNDRWLGKQDIKSVRGTIVFKPTDNISNVTVIQHNEEGGNNIASTMYSMYGCPTENFTGTDGITRNISAANSACPWNPGNPDFNAYIAAHPGLFPGGTLAWVGVQKALGPGVTEANSSLFHRAISTYLTNTTTIELSSDLTLKNIFGYNKNRANDGFDYDSFPYFLFEDGALFSADHKSRVREQGYITDTKQFSEELQLQGKAFGGNLTYVVGGFYSSQDDVHESNLAYTFFFGGLNGPVQFAYNAKNKDKSKAAFAQGTYKLTDKLSLTGGFRYTWESLSLDQLPKSAYLNFGANHEAGKSSSPSWLVSLDYQVTDTLLAYVSHRGSWRTGGFNWNVFPVNLPGEQGGNVFVPEKTKDIEIGLKYAGDELGVPVSGTLAFYNQWTKNVQRAAYVVNPLNGTVNLFTVNVPKAQTTGIEAGFTIKPVHWLTLGASGAYTNARFTDGRVNVIGVAGVFGPFADAPKYTGNIFADITQELPDEAGILTLHYELYGQTSDTFSNTANTTAPRTTLPGYTLHSARISWSEIYGSKVTAAIYGRNLFNRAYFAGGNGSGPGSGSNAAVPGVPRMFGGELTFKF
jgi:iron complex outermembrane receptor protein